jgi:molybdopterin converting factor small subunit
MFVFSTTSCVSAAYVPERAEGLEQRVVRGAEPPVLGHSQHRRGHDHACDLDLVQREVVEHHGGAERVAEEEAGQVVEVLEDHLVQVFDEVAHAAVLADAAGVAEAVHVEDVDDAAALGQLEGELCEASRPRRSWSCSRSRARRRPGTARACSCG